MLLGYWYGCGGILLDPLSLVYTLHWMASLYNHLFPCYMSFIVDTYFIDMVTMERLVYMNPDLSVWIHGCFVFFLLWHSNHFHPFVCFGKVMFSVFLTGIVHQPPFWYNLSFFVSAVLYVLSDLTFHHSQLYPKAMAHVFFHACISYTAYEESFLYDKNQEQLFHSYRIMIYLLYVGKCLALLCFEKK